MKKINILISFGLFFITIFLACSQNENTGIVISVPASIPLEELGSGKMNIKFVGNTVKVKMKDGKIIDAIASSEQMSEAFRGKNKATLQKVEGNNWTIIKLEENVEKK